MMTTNPTKKPTTNPAPDSTARPAARLAKPVSFTPGLAADDPAANYWLAQATVRLRREICWAWRERTGGPGPAGDTHALPPRADRVSGALDLSRYADAKRTFFETDPTAAYLSQQLCLPKPHVDGKAPQGSFGWVVSSLRLDDFAAFTMALALAAAADHAMGPVIGACLNDPNRPYPTLALAQKLWDRPADALLMADPAHPLRRCGLLPATHVPGQAETSGGWDAPLVVPPLLARRLLFPDSPLPETLREIDPPAGAGPLEAGPLPDSARVVVARLRAALSSGLRVVPIRGSRGSPRGETARAIASASGLKVVEWRGGAALIAGGELWPAATLCWLNGHALYITYRTHERAGQRQTAESFLTPIEFLPNTLFLGVEERGDLGSLPAEMLLPCVDVPKLSYAERVAEWRSALGPAAGERDAEIAECSRRFRYEKETIRAVSGALAQSGTLLPEGGLLAACRAELPVDMGELAQQVTPRFSEDELVLPYRQRLQFEEIFRAMSALTQVHYAWGAAKAWNEGGVSVLFAGPSGTGKTMAAEVLATRLELPMYRIDLSQVVNKYIGETEKNLKKLFDVADISDTLLFFDEADALFGRRSEVKDAHDRYANLEISYLLERMERFKGLAILATNRKKDLDEAFLRRLRYVVDFPVPEPEQRRQIWMRAVPEGADGSSLDFDFLAQQFQLSGGHIKSIVFNACLQTASAQRNHLTMEAVLLAVRREYDKLNRSLSLDAFGPYADVLENLEREQRE